MRAIPAFYLQDIIDFQSALEISFSQNELQKIYKTSRELENRSCANRWKHFSSQANIDTARIRPTVPVWPLILKKGQVAELNINKTKLQHLIDLKKLYENAKSNLYHYHLGGKHLKC